MLKHYHEAMISQLLEANRVAFFGGSFDPPHLGHLAVAHAARAALDLDRVLFAPVGAQPLKPQGSTATFEDRLAMTELAIAGQPGFAISLADAPTIGGLPNYTLDTLRRLRAQLKADGELFCLMGADSFIGLRKWHGGAEIPFVASLIVASRPGQLLHDLTASLPDGMTLDAAPKSAATTSADRLDSSIEVRTYLLRNRVGQTARFHLLPGLHVEISASAIRDQVRSASAFQTREQKLLPTAVADYIRANGLYR
jgi:nicotinate-nucleotide adenylyltransferase